MDFELPDWTVDSNVVKLNNELFGPKNQLAVPSLKKERKRKFQEVEKDQLKKCKKDKMRIEKSERSQLMKEEKSEKHEQFKDEKENKKIKKRTFSDVEASSAMIENKNIEQENQKKKIKSHKKLKIDTEKKNVVNKVNTMKNLDSGNDLKDKKTNSESVPHVLSSQKEKTEGVKRKRKKKKKNSSKKNKYKHLDEQRLAERLKQSDVMLNSKDTVPKFTTNGKRNNLDQNKTDSILPVFEKEKMKKLSSSGFENNQKEKEVKMVKKEGNYKCLNDFEAFKTRSNNGHVNKGPSQESSIKNSPFKLAKLQKVLLQKDSLNKKDKKIIELDKKRGDKSVNIGKSKEKQKVTEDKPLTLRDRMMEKLKSARFRYINERLYTQTGSDAAKLFQDDEESFHCYHEGFQNQVEKWPTNPVDIIVKQIKAGSSSSVVGDFGCGDAKIARSVPNKVHSFDLVSLNQHVTVCNIEKVPLKSSTLDIAVFCLSLMGTNLADYIKEANRVLKFGGTLMIAEVTSRIQKIGKFIQSIERMGFQLTNKDTSNSMFIIMDFKKTGASGESLPQIQLDPCLYKKR